MTRSVAPTGSRTPEFRTLAERLSWARETAPLTQDELAAHLGISTRTVQNYESGETRPPLNRLLLWANACDTDYDWLAGDAYEAGPDPRTRAQSGERASTEIVRPIHRRRTSDPQRTRPDTPDYRPGALAA